MVRHVPHTLIHMTKLSESYMYTLAFHIIIIIMFRPLAEGWMQ